MTRSKPRAVIFDFGGVLCFHPSEQRFAAIADYFGISTPRLIEIFWDRRLEYDCGRLSPREYWADVAHRAGKSFDPAELPNLVQFEIELWNNYDRRILDWVAELQAGDIRTAILSNLPPGLGENLRATPGFLDPFDHVTFSYELRVVKPQPEIYRETLHGLNVAAEDALFLDDKPANIAGAEAVGLMGEVYSTWEDFLRSTLPRYELPAPQ